MAFMGWQFPVPSSDSHAPSHGGGKGERHIAFLSWNCHVFLVSDASVFSQDLQEKKSLSVLEMLENVPKLS